MLNQAQQPVYITFALVSKNAAKMQVIVYHPASASTCYFHGVDSGNALSFSKMDHWKLKPALLVNNDRTCVTCHAAHPFIKTPVINTDVLLSKAGLSRSTVKIDPARPDQGSNILLRAWAIENFDWANAFDGKKVLWLPGTPEVAVQTPSGRWKSMEQKVVAAELLAKASNVPASSWKPRLLKTNTVPSCQSCHSLSVSNVHARLAGTVAGRLCMPSLEYASSFRIKEFGLFLGDSWTVAICLTFREDDL